MCLFLGSPTNTASAAPPPQSVLKEDGLRLEHISNSVPATTAALIPAASSSENVARQVREMDDFEREQQAKFSQEIEEHKRLLEQQQLEHRNILNQQRLTAHEHMKSMQDKQSLALKQQQAQCEMLMKQLQSQMEAEMRMKAELVRNQMQMLAEHSTSNCDNNNLESIFGGLKSSNKNSNSGLDENSVKEREERLKAAHQEEIVEMQKRIQHWIHRTQQMAEEHQKELEAERERRRKDLFEQSQDHKATVETIRADYAILVDKIKELKNMEMEASIDARDSAKYENILSTLPALT